MASVSSTQLQKYLDELDEASKRISELVASLPADRAMARPNEASWSVADNIAHLNLTTEAFLPELVRSSREGREKGLTGFGSFGMGIVARVLIFFIDPSSSVKVKTKTKKPFEPVAIQSVDAELQRFLSLQKRLAECIVTFDGLAIDKLKVTSPFDGKLKYTVVGAFAIIAAHQRRHLMQAERAAATTTAA